MDGETGVIEGVDQAALGQIAPALQGVIDAGDLSGAVTLIWRGGEELQFTGARPARHRGRSADDPRHHLPHRLDDQAGHLGGGADADGGRQAQARRPDHQVDARVRRHAGAEDAPPGRSRTPTLRRATSRSRTSSPTAPASPTASPRSVRSPTPTRRRWATCSHSDMAPDAWMKALGGLPLTYPPGERFHYSHATDVLGFLVGRIEGKPFRDVLIERIFEPLGMVDTDFYIPPGEARPRRHGLPAEGRPARSSRWPFPRHDAPPSFCGGGGGLVSTLDDYLKFARMLLGERRGRRRAAAEARDRGADAHQPADRRAARDPVHGHPVLDGPGLRPRPLGHHRPGEAGLDGRRHRRARSAGRARSAPGGRPIRPRT